MNVDQLRKELRHSNEGLAQMQAPGVGYFEDENDKQPHEISRLDKDVREQTEGIARIERKIMNANKN